MVPAPSPNWPYLLAWTTSEACQHAERAQPPEACPALLCTSVATHQVLCADLDATREGLMVVAASHREQKDSTELCSPSGPREWCGGGGAAGR